MTVNPKYLIYHDLIGLNASARPNIKPNSESFLDIGIIIDESKNMLIAKNNNMIKKYVKKDYVFQFKLPKSKEREKDLRVEVNGDKIVGRPENRLRSLKKKKWLKK
jgi:RNase P/RNase MRP subunit p29